MEKPVPRGTTSRTRQLRRACPDNLKIFEVNIVMHVRVPLLTSRDAPPRPPLLNRCPIVIRA